MPLSPVSKESSAVAGQDLGGCLPRSIRWIEQQVPGVDGGPRELFVYVPRTGPIATVTFPVRNAPDAAVYRRQQHGVVQLMHAGGLEEGRQEPRSHDPVEDHLEAASHELASRSTGGADDRLVLGLRLCEPWLLRSLIQKAEEGIPRIRTLSESREDTIALTVDFPAPGGPAMTSRTDMSYRL